MLMNFICEDCGELFADHHTECPNCGSYYVEKADFVADDIIDLETPHNYPNGGVMTWTYIAEGAEKILLTFDQQTAFENGYDNRLPSESRRSDRLEIQLEPSFHIRWLQDFPRRDFEGWYTSLRLFLSFGRHSPAVRWRLPQGHGKEAVFA